MIADATIGTILEGLRLENSEVAWRSFLTSYSDLIYSIVRTFARDADDAGDCFLFICEKLAEKQYRRLRTFNPNGAARFSTWLRAVVRNLFLDWHRSRFGRRQVFRSVASLSGVDQAIFGLLFHRRLSMQIAWCELSKAYPDISYSEFEMRSEKLRSLLTSRQMWLLSTATMTFESLDNDTEPGIADELVDLKPDPETLAVLKQTHSAVSRALKTLQQSDRLILRLRFSEGMGLQQIAKLVGLKDAQTADRRIRGAVELVRQKLGVPKTIVGKPRSASV